MREEQLIRAMQAQKEDALTHFLARYTPLLRYVIAPILPQAEDLEECVSEVAMRVWEGIRYYSANKGSFTGWLTAIARNAALNRARAAKKAEAGELTEEIPSPAPTPEEVLLRKERQEHLARALLTLRPADRRLFFRKYYYRQSTAQIAAELGTTPRAVEGRLYRIKKQLKKQLGGEIHDA